MMRLNYLRLVVALLALLAISATKVFGATPKAVTATNTTTSLTWTASTQNTDGTPLTNLAGYHIWHGVVSKTYEAMPATVPAGTLTYVFPKLEDGMHYFAVSAFNSANPAVESAKTAEVSVAVKSVTVEVLILTLGPYSYEPTGTTAAPTMSSVGLVVPGLTCGPATRLVGTTKFCQITRAQTDLIGWPADKTLKNGLWAKAAP